MKIGFDSKRLFCNFTGLGNYSRTLLNNVVEFYPVNDYYLYTTKINKTPETNQFFNWSRYNVNVPSTFFKAFWRTYSIKKQLKSDKIQLYHGLSNEIPINIHKTPIKSVVTIHDLIFKILPETYSAVDRKVYDIKFKYACDHADRIISLSENTKKDIVRFYHIKPKKIEVIYQACNPIYYHSKNQKKNDLILQLYNIPPEYLLSVGSVEPRKNLKRIIESFRYLKRDLHLPLVVIGKGGIYKQQAEQMVRKAGLEKLVIWIDSLANNEHLQSIYQNSKALIYPSLYEGFGLPVAEALLSKTPVVTSDRSSLKEAGGPGSLYIDPESPEQIAAAIEKVLTNSAFRQNMIDLGYLYAHQNFAAEIVTKQIMNCYQKTLEGN
ncbi:MAG: glycosyltransferase family 1 protein [Porphyromonadaceae bacterium]|nr:MAG: glycosyltransferase family 1 protein [Porphyromonadaceae bacterium]